MNRLLYALLLISLPLVGQAKHIIGGELSMRSLGKPGYYRIQMNQFWDDANAEPGARESFLSVHIFRKRNPVLMATYVLDRRSLEPIIYKNPTCARTRKLNTLNATFYNDIQLKTDLYDDPAGYYIVWERCCRDNNLSNLANSVNVGMVFYLEFPALVQQGRPIVNSSPMFTPPAGNYICLNQPFATTYSATDADGDELRYSLVTPYQGYTDEFDTGGDDTPRLSYPLIGWGAGYGAASAIPGTPPLQIDPKTGQLTVTASQLGYYLFSVQCDEYRNGQKIGSIRRDFVLPVIDCPQTTPPLPVVRSAGQPIQEATLCAGTSLTLATEADAQWVYQWQRDGNNLPGSTAANLTVTQAGEYRVIKSFAALCARDTASVPVRVAIIPPPDAKLRLLTADGLAQAKPPLCQGDAVLLSLSATSPGNRYRWEVDNVPVAATASQIRVEKSGLYRVTVTVEGTTCEAADALPVTFQLTPIATLTASVRQFCPGDSARLSTTDDPSYRYQWEPASGAASATHWVSVAGTYRVTITSAAGCSAVSAPLSLTTLPRPNVAADSIAPLCASSARFNLPGVPAGGIWSGRGTADGQFDPAVAGVGLHRLTYTVSNSSGCRNAVNRWIRTTPPLVLTGPLAYQVQRGDTARLALVANGPVAQVQWQPGLYLDAPNQLSPLYQSGQSQQYTVVAKTGAGCQTQVRVAVVVVDRLHIPSAFSPNGDGLNDRWQLINLDAFSTCEVTVFNRWGELIYQGIGPQQTWDGTYRQRQAEPGVYLYQVRLTPTGHAYRGQVTLLR